MANKSTPELLELIDYSLSKLEKLTDIAAAVNTLGTIPQAHARITLAGALSGQITDIAWDARIAQQYFEDLAELVEIGGLLFLIVFCGNGEKLRKCARGGLILPCFEKLVAIA